MTDFRLSDLDRIVAARLREGGEASYTASLAAAGQPKAAQKLGEEAVETVIAAVAGDGDALRDEAADLLYHLVVVLRLGGISLEAVMAELERRTVRSGLEEKASRTAG